VYPKRVLVVDDSKLLQRMYRLVFMKYKDCVIKEALNGLEALEILSGGDEFDFIILDINMPVMNGLQFMEKFKQTGNRHIPIIVVSTEGKEEDTLRAMKLGAWGYVQKPFKCEELYSIVEKVMAKRPPALKTGKYY
jgi:two-component system chemotaxis response regulator CheY